MSLVRTKIVFDSSPLALNSLIKPLSASSTLSSVRTRFARMGAQTLAGDVVGNHERNHAGLSDMSGSLKLGSCGGNQTGVVA